MKITRKVINFNKVNQTGGVSLSSNQQFLEKRVQKNEENIKGLVHGISRVEDGVISVFSNRKTLEKNVEENKKNIMELAQTMGRIRNVFK